MATQLACPPNGFQTNLVVYGSYSLGLSGAPFDQLLGY